MQDNTLRHLTRLRYLTKGAALTFAIALPGLALAQTVSRDDWRMHRASPIVTTDAFTSPANGDVRSYELAPPIPAANDPAWEVAPNPQIIAFAGHDGGEKSRLIGLTCRQAFDYVFFDTIVTVPENYTAHTFTIAFQGMDDGSRITIFNGDFPNGTPDMPNGVNNFVKLNENASMDLAQFLRPGANRVVITQVDDCPVDNRLQSAEVVLDGQPILAAAEARPEPGPFISASYGDVHITTGDRLKYDFQVPGDFVIFRNADGSFQAQGRHVPWPETPGTSVTSAAAALVDGNRLEMYYADNSFYLNGEPLDLSATYDRRETVTMDLAGGGQLQATYMGRYVRIQIERFGPTHPGYKTEKAQTIRLHHNLNWGYNDVLSRNGAKDPIMGGLSGSEDGNRANDLMTRSGEIIAQPASQAEIDRMGETWRVQPDENLFQMRPDTTVAPAAPAIVLADLPEETRIEAATTCLRGGVTDINLLRDCTYDVAATSDPVFAEGAAILQAVLDENPAQPQIVPATGIDPVQEIGENALELAAASIRTDTGIADESADEAAVEPAADPTSEAVTAAGPSVAAELARDQKMTMNGHYLIFQQDGNLCTYRSADNGWVWCINNDPTVRFGDTARVVMTDQGQLTGLDSAGQVIYALPPQAPGTPSDAFITEEGALEIINNGRVVWSSN